MPTSYTLGKHFEQFVQAQLASGRYNNASEVLRDALRLMEDRERKLAALDAAIERGIDDINAGRVRDADPVFDELEAKYARLAKERGEPRGLSLPKRPRPTSRKSATTSPRTMRAAR